MTNPITPSRPVRLDDLIEAVERTHTDDLDRLSAAVVAGEHLGEVADHLIGHFVDRARRSGASWTDIGRSMGVTRQAAQKRFTPSRPGESASIDPNEGFARFTPRARNVVMASQNEARRTGHREIHPAHLLLGLLSQPEAIGTGVLVGRVGATDTVREAAESALPPVEPDVTVPDLVPYDNASRKVLELTFREALRLEHTSVGTEHILLALLEQEGDAGPLTTLGLRKPEVEADVVAAVTEADRKATEEAEGDAPAGS
ncbi:Clp protease N-terminal domain-containing protein [Streptomyces sp. ST2-7A]|uniref:Clp protease N-terminal domain-containing protein n=1 Tax=Streptomyces sp. ST2-7A TaxID=2907214 RepID=UPI001F4673BD|nr:Clp protease N-terminal domain-containing protein [Streptomyces sp. ST2-7A]MCE7079087.1 ATP-dependent Clp protease ATP-binding subunit [Streptomyces sp. ST2-7A]